MENGFAEVFKNLARYKSENNFNKKFLIIKIIIYVQTRISKFFAALLILDFSTYTNYFDDPTKLFLDLFKFLDISAKSFFRCSNY